MKILALIAILVSGCAARPARVHVEHKAFCNCDVRITIVEGNTVILK